MNYKTKKRLQELERISGRSPTDRTLLGTVTTASGKKNAYEDESGRFRYRGTFADLISSTKEVTSTEAGRKNKLFSILEQITNRTEDLTD